MKLVLPLGLVLVSLVLVSCGRQASPSPAPGARQSDHIPFSIGGMALGMDKEAARSIAPLKDCQEEKSGRVRCVAFFDAAFLAGRVELLNVGFHLPSSDIASLKFFVGGGRVSVEDIQRAWGPEVRCITSADAERLEKLDVPVAGNLVPELRRFDLIPSGNGFTCIGSDRRFLGVGTTLDGGMRSVSMLYLNAASADLLARVVHAVEDQRARAERLKSF